MVLVQGITDLLDLGLGFFLQVFGCILYLIDDFFEVHGSLLLLLDRIFFWSQKVWASRACLSIDIDPQPIVDSLGSNFLFRGGTPCTGTDPTSVQFNYDGSLQRASLVRPPA